MLNSSVDILVYVEDPGAANFVASLPRHAREFGLNLLITSQGSGAVQLQRLGADFRRTRQTDGARSLLATYRPKVAIIGTSENSGSMGLALIDAAKDAAIPSIGVVDGPTSAVDRFRGISRSPLTHLPDWLAVPDAATCKQFVSLGVAGSRIVICGHPHTDTVFAQRSQFETKGRGRIRAEVFSGSPQLMERKIIVFAAEISDGLSPSEFRRSPAYNLTGWSGSEFRTEIVLEEFLEAITKFKPKPGLVLRLHPKNTVKEFAAYIDYFDLVSQGDSPLPLLFAADAVVGMTSIILHEAVLLGRPTLSIVPRSCERNWLSTIEAGLTPCAGSSAEIEAYLCNLMDDVDMPDADALQSMFPKDAAKRMISMVNDIIHGAP